MFKLDSKILLVDDSPAIRISVKEVLATLGFKTVQEASDGSIAFEMLTEAYIGGVPFDLVIADWHMGKVSGYDLLQQIRQSPALGGIPFIMMTVENSVPEVLKAIRSGVSEYLVKPVDEKNLLQKLETAYKRQQPKSAS
jgi:two-component system chemotaxis response regulator CheY